MVMNSMWFYLKVGSDVWDVGRQTKKWIQFQTAFDFSQANLKCQTKLSRVGESTLSQILHMLLSVVTV